MDTKKCNTCGTEKPFSEFYLQHHSRQILQWECKKCNNERRKRTRLADPDHNARRRARYKNSPNMQKAAQQWVATDRLKHPKKKAAPNVVSKALKHGILVKPNCCEECDSTRNLVAHHDDYDKPLEVRWLCGSCHAKWHDKYGRGLNFEGKPPKDYYKLPDIKSDDAVHSP